MCAGDLNEVGERDQGNARVEPEGGAELHPEGRAQANSQPVALCFSGGGIRSATFNLGVLQELARNKWLGQFDLLSTVSGGGYIGAWFAAQIVRAKTYSKDGVDALLDRDRAAAKVIADLARADDRGESSSAGEADPTQPAEESAMGSSVATEPAVDARSAVAWLRAYSNYLSPTWGLSRDALALVSIYLRNLAIHWAILLPLLVALLLIPRVVHLIVVNPTEGGNWLVWLIVASTVLMGAFSTNGPPAEGERRSHLVNVGWHWVCFVTPLLVVPICLTALAFSKRQLEGPLSSDVLESLTLSLPFRFALGGAIMYFAGSALVLAYRMMLLLVPEDRNRLSPGVFRWVVERLGVDEGVDPAANARAWLKRMPLRIPLSVLTGALAGLLCGLAFEFARQQPLDRELNTAVMPVLFVLSIWLASAFRVAVATRLSDELSREWWATATGVALKGTLGWIALATIVLWLPIALLEWSMLRTGVAAGSAGLGGLLLAGATAAVGYWSKHGADLSRKVSRWYEQLGTRMVELAAVLTLLGASLVINLVVGAALNPQFSHRLPNSTVAVVGACASSGTGEVLGARVNHVQMVDCRTAKLLLDDMSAHGHDTKSIAAARNRYLADCSMRERRTDDHVVDMLCPLPPPTDKEERTGSGSETGKNRETVRMQAGLPVSLMLAGMYRVGLESPESSLLITIALVLVMLALLMAGLVGPNAYSLQAMYANRLTRAYLGASNRDSSKADTFSGFNKQDDMPLAALAGVRPQLVINATLNIVRAGRETLAWQQRKAAAFTLTADSCGSELTGDTPTAEFGMGLSAITLGQAISISGAAVSPSMGYHSSPAVSAVLALFNLRLGSWLPNPRFFRGRRDSGVLQSALAVVNELISNVHGAKQFVYVSDGGHFENLGVYEMLRRKCRLIVAVDAGCDPGYEFSDVENLLRKARVDLGVQIDIHEVRRCIARLRAGKLRHLHGRIHYPDGSAGQIVILKPVMCGDEPYDVMRYAETALKSGSVFPQQSTADQFFDEAQFESYRMLGRHTVRAVFGDSPEPPPPPSLPESDEPNAPPWPPTGHHAQQGPAQAGSVEGMVGGVAGAVNSLGSMGQAALLASAITFTGVVGVTGVVRLTDSTVSIDERSLTRLESAADRLAKESGTIRFDGDSLKALTDWSNAGIAVNVDGLNERLSAEVRQVDWSAVADSASFSSMMDRLKIELGNITVMVKPQDGQVFTVDMRTGFSTVDLESSILRLDRLSNALMSTTVNLEGASRQLKDALSELRSTVDLFKKAVETGDPQNVLKVVRDIETILGQIQNSVDEISPRNTVRGGQ